MWKVKQNPDSFQSSNTEKVSSSSSKVPFRTCCVSWHARNAKRHIEKINPKIPPSSLKRLHVRTLCQARWGSALFSDGLCKMQRKICRARRAGAYFRNSQMVESTGFLFQWNIGRPKQHVADCGRLRVKLWRCGHSRHVPAACACVKSVR